MLESVLIVASLAISLVLVTFNIFMWKVVQANAAMMVYTAMYLEEKDSDYGEPLKMSGDKGND